MMKSVGENQELPKGEVPVMPVDGQRKRRRVRKLAAERHQKPKKNWDPGELWTAQGVGYRRKRAIRCAKVVRRREHMLPRQRKDDITSRTQKGRMEEKFEGPGMQKWHKMPRPHRAVSRQNRNKGPRRQTVPLREKELVNQHYL
jgi:hypothetical protein